MKGESLQKRKQTWLKYSDDRTAGIMGLLPLVQGMPMRCTDNIDRDRQLYKHTRVTLEGLELDPVDVQILDTCTDAEYVLTLPPLALFVRREMQEFESDDAERARVERVELVRRSWSPDTENNVHVNRRGFQVVPNFAGTIHSFVGASLDAALLDCLHFSRTPKLEEQLKGYLGISRVRTAAGLLIVQPYHPMLFRQGCLPGPELLMQFWRGQLAETEIQAKWEELEKAAKKQEKRLDKMSWECGGCGRQLKADGYGAGRETATDQWNFHKMVLERVLVPGANRYCVGCKAKRRASAGGAGGRNATRHELILCTGAPSKRKQDRAIQG